VQCRCRGASVHRHGNAGALTVGLQDVEVAFALHLALIALKITAITARNEAALRRAIALVKVPTTAGSRPLAELHADIVRGGGAT
jgi:hypothetical protein